MDDITRCDTETVTKTVTNWFYQASQNYFDFDDDFKIVSFLENSKKFLKFSLKKLSWSQKYAVFLLIYESSFMIHDLPYRNLLQMCHSLKFFFSLLWFILAISNHRKRGERSAWG